MSEFLKIITEAVENYAFCYAKPGVHGHVKKEKCSCAVNGNYCCQAYQDSQRFHEYMKDIRMDDRSTFIADRKEIIAKIRDEFKDSQWYKDNIIE